MSNFLTTADMTKARTLVPARASLPEPSSGLALLIHRMTSAEHASAEIAPTDDERQEAARLLPAYEEAMRPVGRNVFLAWLALVNAAARNPVGEKDFEVKFLVLWPDCDDLPASGLTHASRRKVAFDGGSFFPGLGDIRKAAEATARPVSMTRYALRRIATHKPAEPPKSDDGGGEGGAGGMDDAQRAHRFAAEVRTVADAAVARARAARGNTAPLRPAPRTEPAPVRAYTSTDAQLIEGYRQEIRDGRDRSGAMAARLRFLEARQVQG